MAELSPMQKVDLNTMHVASPCSVSWDSMNGNDRSRLCGQCDRRVYNISGMTADAASKLLLNRTDRVCVRLHRRADGTVLTGDCPKGLAAYRKRVTTLAGAAFAAVLGLFSVASGQRVSLNDSQGVRSETSLESPMIEGTVRDQNGAVIADAIVAVKTANGKTLTRKTDHKGRFRLLELSLSVGRNRIAITANGFDTFRDEFSVGRREMIDYPVILAVGHVVGVVVIRPPSAIDPRSSSISTTVRIDRD